MTIPSGRTDQTEPAGSASADPTGHATADDRPYHHGDLRAELLERALEHIASGGVDKLSLRALAREAGVSATAPYRHFPTRRCLLAALATEGFEQLSRVAREAVAAHPDDPAAGLTALALAYIDHARREPVRYRLMFGSVIGDFAPYEALHRAGDRAIEPLLETLARGVETGVFIDRPVPILAGTCWATVHGIANLLIDKAPPPLAAGSPCAPGTEAQSGSAGPGAMTVLQQLGNDPAAAVALHMRSLLRHPEP